MTRYFRSILFLSFVLPTGVWANESVVPEIEVFDCEQILQEDTVYKITKEINLNARTLRIPGGCVLKFDGGMLYNGTLIGDRTQVDYNGAVFKGITIDGTWNVPIIRSSMFADIDQENVICNLPILSDDAIENVIVIDPGDYWVSFAANASEALALRSNTKLVLNGNIFVKSNAWDSYFVVSIRGKNNVSVSGSGSITGDRELHCNRTAGDMGIGFRIVGSDRITIQDLTLKDMWGDGIYVGGWAVSTAVTLKNLTIQNCRRQGISVTNGEGLVIENNIIHAIGGARPGAAIDLEPNVGHGERVNKIRISSNHLSECEGPVISIFSADVGLVNSVVIEDNEIENDTGIALNLSRRFTNVRIADNRLCGSLSFKNNSYPAVFEGNTIVCPHLRFINGDGSGDFALNGYHFIGNTIICSGDIRARGRNSIWMDNVITVEGSQLSIGGTGSVVSSNTIHSKGTNIIYGGVFSDNIIYCTIRDVNRSLISGINDIEIIDNKFFIEEVTSGANLYCLFSISSGKCNRNMVKNVTGRPLKCTIDFNISKNGKVSSSDNSLDTSITLSKTKRF